MELEAKRLNVCEDLRLRMAVSREINPTRNSLKHVPNNLLKLTQSGTKQPRNLTEACTNSLKHVPNNQLCTKQNACLYISDSVWFNTTEILRTNKQKLFLIVKN